MNEAADIVCRSIFYSPDADIDIKKSEKAGEKSGRQRRA